MIDLQRLIAAAGSWAGTSTLTLDPREGKSDSSESALTVTPILDGTFVRLDYDWSFSGTRHQGMMLVGCEPKRERVTIQWVDSFHNGRSVMPLVGPMGSEETLIARGSYSAPTGPDWGWRIALTPAADLIRVVMHNLWPDGSAEDIAVEAEYRRAT